MSKCRESSTLKSVCSNTVEYGVSNSSLEFERLRTQERIAERLTKETVSNARQKTLTHRCSTLSWTARRCQRLSKFQSNSTRDSRTGFSLMYEREETLSSHNDTCQRFEGYRSQYSDKESGASGQNILKGTQWKDRCTGFRRCS